MSVEYTMSALIGIVLLILLLAAAKYLYRVFRSEEKELLTKLFTDEYNTASGIEFAGYILSVFIIISPIFHGLIEEHYTVGGIVNFAITALANSIVSFVLLLVLSKFTLRRILKIDVNNAIQQNNTAVGILIASILTSLSIIINKTIHGTYDYSHIVPNIVFICTGICTLWLSMVLFRVLTRYDDNQEIHRENIAASISISGVCIAVAIIIGNALSGEFNDYGSSFYLYIQAVMVIGILYPVRQWLVQGIFLGKGFHLYGGVLDTEISEHRNTVAGFVEAVTYIGTSFIASALMN